VGAKVGLFHDSISKISQDAQGTLGVAAQVLDGRGLMLVRGGLQHPMQSVYKLAIAMAALHEVDDGNLELQQEIGISQVDLVGPQLHSPFRDAHPKGGSATIRELLRLAIEESDGTASDVLLRLLGGSGRVMSYLRGVRVRELNVANTEKEMGNDPQAEQRNWATPGGAISLLTALRDTTNLADTSRTLLVRWMTTTKTGANRIRGLLPSGTVVAHKTGTSRTVNGVTAATNDIGIITLPDGRSLAVAIFLSGSKLGEAERDTIIARAARAAYMAWVR
jgi:beta-lactamase class A